MKYTIIKLDRRYNGHHKFKYCVSTVVKDYHQSQRDFSEWRDWCWGTYGPSMERDWACGISHVDKTNPTWAWDTERGNKRLYLKGDAELTLFELKFG